MRTSQKFLLAVVTVLCLLSFASAQAGEGCFTFFASRAVGSSATVVTREPSGPFALGPSAEQWRWRGFNNRFVRSATWTIQNNIGKFLEAKERGHSFLKLLADAGGTISKTKLVVPSPNAIVETYYRDMNRAIAEGVVRADEVLIPALVYRDFFGKKVGVPFGQKVPFGLFPAYGVLSTAEFIMFMRQGYFPVGDSMIRNGAFAQTVTIHDFEHLAVFRQYPRYMAAMRKGVGGINPNDRYIYYINQRVNLFVEHLTYLSPAKRSQFHSLLPKYLRRDLSAFGLENIQRYLEKLPTKHLIEIQSRLNSQYHGLVDAIGGSMNDLTYEPYLGNNTNSILFFWNAQSAAAVRSGSRQIIISSLSKYILALDKSSQLTFDDWISQIVKPRLDEDSKLYEFLCKSGIWSAGSPISHQFCH